LGERKLKTFTDLSQIGQDDSKTLQVIAYNLPSLSTLVLECGEKANSGWKQQVPAPFGLLEVTKYYTSRVVFRYYPIANPELLYIATYNENETPGLKGFKKFTGTSV